MLAVGVGVASMAIAVASAAGLQYSKPELLDKGKADSENPLVVVEPSGSATAIWERADRRGSATSLIQTTRFDDHGNQLGPVRTLSGKRSTTPALAPDEQGGAAVVWTRFDDDGRVEAVRLGADGAPAGPVQIVSPPDRRATEPDVAVDGAGVATAVWSSGQIQAVRLGPDGTPEAPPVPVSEQGNSRSPQVAVDQSGRATVAWRRGKTIRAVRLGRDGQPEAPELELTPDRSRFVRSPLVEVDDAGRATVVWEGGSKGFSGIHAVPVEADGVAGDLKRLSRRVRDGRFPDLAVNPEGRAVVAFQGWRPPQGLNGFPQGRAIYSVIVDADGAPGRIRGLSKRVGAFSEPRAALDPRGRATVVWPRSDGISTRIQAVRLRANGTPDNVHTLSAPGRPNHANAASPDVAVDNAGRATVIWQRLVGRFFRIEATRSAK